MAAMTTGSCPRCGAVLAPVGSDGLACPSCHGVFVFRASLDAYLSNAGALGEATSYRQSAKPNAERAEQGAYEPEFRYLMCPICGRTMNRENMRRSGVIADTCLFHGTWFDDDEAWRVAARVAPDRGRG